MKIVEIDESLFTKRKSNAVRVLPQEWIFCHETGYRFLVKVPNREGKTLLGEKQLCQTYGRVIRQRIMRKLDLRVLKLNKYNFVDPDIGENTQQIERIWCSAKWKTKRRPGTYHH